MIRTSLLIAAVLMGLTGPAHASDATMKSMAQKELRQIRAMTLKNLAIARGYEPDPATIDQKLQQLARRDEVVAARVLAFRDSLLFQSPSTRTGRVAQSLLRESATNLAKTYQLNAKSLLIAAKGGDQALRAFRANQRLIKRYGSRARSQLALALGRIGFSRAQVRALTPLIPLQ